MAERSERAVLNHLIETCRDAERGFRVAAEHVKTPQLRALFIRLADQRHEFANALLPHAQRLGGAQEVDGTTTAALHRQWIHMKALLATDPDHAVVEGAIRGERFAVAAYDEAVHDLLPPDSRDLIEEQDAEVRAAAAAVKAVNLK